MIIIFGTRVLKNEMNNYVGYDCSICHHESATILSTWKWFTLFWIPIFPMEKKKYWIMCNKCGNGYKLTKEEVQEILQKPLR